MARNRKRTRDRRPRRPDDGAGRAIVGGSDFNPAPDLDAAPDPLTHASPDAELAEAQLALGRPDLAHAITDDDAFGNAYEDEYQALEDQVDHAAAGSGGGGARRGGGAGGGPAGSGGVGGGGELALPGGAAVARPGVFTRMVTFLQGSWRELQRVQWPDRRQVMQATGVVLGFVIVAGIYLGVADWIAEKIVHLILTK
ncbi:MAG: preprotein translocase subunit SecE [Solirubrobacteraceae bacterium]